ncbi:MAG TPA: oligopeptide/dipeptide ABC transporter ATP-binding protein [Streptosporangiaceae bacterium]
MTAPQPAGLPGLRAGLSDPFLLVRGVSKTFTAGRGRRGRQLGVRAVDGVSFDLASGETLALVGETGCGKSTVARCVLRLTEPTSGQVLLDGQDLAALSPAQLRALRRQMQVVFQDPYSSLNPRMTVRAIVAEPLRIHGISAGPERARLVDDILELVGIPPELGHRKPYAFSGGQRQRIAIARALVLHPRLVVLDEPVTALDVSIQAQVLNLLTSLQRQLGLTYLFIVHDLAVAEHIASRVAVMYLGALMEIGDAAAVFAGPLHPYTVALLSAIPVPDPASLGRPSRILLPGEAVPAGDAGLPGENGTPGQAGADGQRRGCRFAPRCPVGRDRELCRRSEPALAQASPGHWVSCHYPGELALSQRPGRPDRR